MASTTTTANLAIPAIGFQVAGWTVVSTAGMVAGTGATVTGTDFNFNQPFTFHIEIVSVTNATTLTIENLDGGGLLPGNVAKTGATITFVAAIPVSLNCSANALLVASACFSDQCLGPDDREAIQLVAMFHELAAVGGTNYVGNLPQLLKDAASWQILNEDQRRQIVTYMTVVNAIKNGAGMSLNMNTLRAQSKCALCLPWEQKKNVELFLKCQLNALNEPD
jgi:hypothetical protein